MNLHESTVTVETKEGPMEAFLVIPGECVGLAAVIVCQEAFGINTHIKEVCRRFALDGYVALAPDMYHRSGKLLTYSYDDPRRREPFSALTNSGVESDINIALDYLTSLPQVDAARIGTVGFCVGGCRAVASTIGSIGSRAGVPERTSGC